MKIFNFEAWRSNRQESKAKNGPVQQLEKLRAQMLDMEVEAAGIDGQLKMRGMERNPNDAQLGNRLEQITKEYQQLLATFNEQLKAENDRRFNSGEDSLELTEPTDDEITAELHRRAQIAA